MSAVDRSTAPDREWRDAVAPIEAAPYAEESIVERGARALWKEAEAKFPLFPWEQASAPGRDYYRRLFRVAAGVLAGPDPRINP